MIVKYKHGKGENSDKYSNIGASAHSKPRNIINSPLASGRPNVIIIFKTAAGLTPLSQ